MTPQEIFDRAVGGVLAQRRPAATYKAGGNLSRCQYRVETPFGTMKCAVGQLIPDERYDTVMDYDPNKGAGYSPPELARWLADRGFDGLVGHNDLLLTLQADHDNAASDGGPEPDQFLPEYRKRAMWTAARFNLSDAVLIGQET